jgi:hypothetical protein
MATLILLLVGMRLTSNDLQVRATIMDDVASNHSSPRYVEGSAGESEPGINSAPVAAGKERCSISPDYASHYNVGVTQRSNDRNFPADP